VGDLWIGGGPLGNIPYRGLTAFRYAANRRSAPSILFKIVVRPDKKLASANFLAAEGPKKIFEIGRVFFVNSWKSPKPDCGLGL
jgi:hypothetical protein